MVCGVGGRSRLQHRRLHGPCLSFPMCELGIKAVPPLWVFEDGVTPCVCSSWCGLTPDLVPTGRLLVSLSSQEVLPSAVCGLSWASTQRGAAGGWELDTVPPHPSSPPALHPAEPAPRTWIQYSEHGYVHVKGFLEDSAKLQGVDPSYGGR